MYLGVRAWGLGSRARHSDQPCGAGVENITIQLDLESAFYFTHLIMTFKVTVPRPEGCCEPPVLTATPGNPRTPPVPRLSTQQRWTSSVGWTAAAPGRCTGTLPTTAQVSSLVSPVPRATASAIPDPVCDQRYSDIGPSAGGKVRPEEGGVGGCEAGGSGLLIPQVIFKVLDTAILVENPHNPKIQGKSQPTLRSLPVRLAAIGGGVVPRRGVGGREVVGEPAQSPSILPPHWTRGARVVLSLLSLPAAMSLLLSLPPISPVSPITAPVPALPSESSFWP